MVVPPSGKLPLRKSSKPRWRIIVFSVPQPVEEHVENTTTETNGNQCLNMVSFSENHTNTRRRGSTKHQHKCAPEQKDTNQIKRCVPIAKGSDHPRIVAIGLIKLPIWPEMFMAVLTTPA